MKREDFTNPCGELTTRYGPLSFVPNSLPPDWRPPERLDPVFAEAAMALSFLNGMLVAAEVSPWTLVIPLIRQEAVASSSIEGIHTTQPALFPLEAIRALKSPKTEEQVNQLRIKNHHKALVEGIELSKDLPFSYRFVTNLHKALLGGFSPQQGTPGEFRALPGEIKNFSTDEVIFIPPPVPEMKKAFSDLEKYVNLEVVGAKNILIQCALMHYQFEAIHPFPDGNGRLGRILISLYLVKKGLLLHPAVHLGLYFAKNKKDYYEKLLAVSQRSEWESWVLFFVAGIARRANETSNKIMRLINWSRETKKMVQQKAPRRWHTLKPVIDYLIAYPIITRPILVEHIGLNPVTASACTDYLMELDILEKMPEAKHPYVYWCRKVLNIINP